MYILYPSIKTYVTHSFQVSDLHTLYIEESGNPDGIPVLYLHSGPGLGSEKYQRRFFDPEVYRIILFDQRGSGRSTPHAELKENTTQDLIEDIEKIRTYLKIDNWILFGSAWGSTLALAYAIKYADRVGGIVVHSVFLGRKLDIDWVYTKGTNRLFPDYWQDFVKLLSETERRNPLQSYYKKLRSSDELTRMASAKNWSAWQGQCATLQPHNQAKDHLLDPKIAVSLAHIETHYFLNNCFLSDNYILKHIDAIVSIPGFVVHGRYNAVAPLEHAWALDQAWNASQLYIVRDAGHSDKEPGMIDALIRVSNKIAKSFKTPNAG